MKPNRTPCLRLAMAAFVVMASLGSQAAEAAARAVRGPMDDLQVTLPLEQVNGPCTPAAYVTYFHPWPPYTNTWPNVSDYVIINCDGDSGWSNYSARGVGYVVSPKGNFSKGDAVLVTIYGHDLDDGSGELKIGGFDAARPQMSFSGETYTGISKTSYPATSADLVRIADLPAFLGSDFDLSPFAAGDPDSVVYVFQATMPAKNLGMRTSGILFSEDFDGGWHVGTDIGGSFGLGTLPGTNLSVTSGAVDVLGVLNGGGNGTCPTKPTGNCLELAGHAGPGSVASIPVFDLDPAHTYIVQFTVVAPEDLPLTVQLGGSTWNLVARPKQKTHRLAYTPPAFEAGVGLSFTGSSAADGDHGPVVSDIVLCAKPAGTTGKCPTP
jgi:hypothetical protein